MTSIRIGVQIEPNDTFWVQVYETISRTLKTSPTHDLIPIEVSDPLTATLLDEQSGLVEDVLAHRLDVLISKDILPHQFPTLLSHKLPIIYLAETNFQHPLFACPRGLHEAARLVGRCLTKELNGSGHILCIGGLVEQNADDGSSRLAGFWEALKPYPEISFTHIPTAWSYEDAFQRVLDFLPSMTQPVDAIFGLSDTLALAARDALHQSQHANTDALVAGINGDPLALAAIAGGSMFLTVETPSAEFGGKALELAYQAANDQEFPSHFSYQPHLITRENVDAVALQKLITIADMPSRMVGVNRRQEQNRLIQLETSAEISRHVGAILDRQAMLIEISHRIRANYRYDEVEVFFWSHGKNRFERLLPQEPLGKMVDHIEQDAVLKEVVRAEKPVFIPNAQSSHRFAPNERWPKTFSRATLPVHLGGKLIGILDLHSFHPVLHPRHELIGLQSLANQLGTIMKNADLYAEALEARVQAERADQLKTRLLANVSHELRTPLNVIIGYAQTALSTLSLYDLDLASILQRDLGYIAQSGQHLLRLINDLLSLSQAEIGALDLYKETITPRALLREVFDSMNPVIESHHVNWVLTLPEQLPLVEVDPVRLRQILFNLLHNANKFTNDGEIELGAQISPPYLHIWVRDTGKGIPIDMQERIFDPFIKMEEPEQRQVGVGLGLAIVRRLVALHGGSLSLESQMGKGSTFHVYLPLPDGSGNSFTYYPADTDPVLLLLSQTGSIAPAIQTLCHQQQLSIQIVQFDDDIEAILSVCRPISLAWDLTEADSDEWELFEQLRQHPQICQLPLIIYGQRQGELTGLTNVLMKPISDKTLLGTLMALKLDQPDQTVLVVDDDPQARKLYQKLAKEALPNYRVQTAENGRVALEKMAVQRPSLVILDLMMPELDGFGVLEYMRANADTCHIPIIVMSGRLLNSEDVRRLDYNQVVFHMKELLSDEEIGLVMQQVLGDADNLSQPTSRFVKEAVAYLHQHYADSEISREDIAKNIGISKQHLDRIFGKELGMSVIECLNRIRIQKAKELMVQTSDTLTLIAMHVGFNDAAYFSRVFRKLEGIPPSAYRKREGI